MQVVEQQQQLIRDETALFLGRRPTDEEMSEALPRAERKLRWIIDREGDLGGIRLEPWYLGKLVEEEISEERFIRFTMTRSQQIEARRQATATEETKKADPIKGRPNHRIIILPEQAACNASGN